MRSLATMRRLDRAPPFPLNHEDIGLGKIHLAHSVFRVVAAVAALVAAAIQSRWSLPI